ncbi:hypothetical protein [Chitinimonas lacunae]|uniref:SWIM-type domain-containing protein n=1 Tax=Chitinimonas lacunae TaxID=1963018 RepID=A0ABV8MTJ0_9NEIS
MPWYDIYRSYDDDALTALANAGLLRRAAKDVEAGKVDWLEQGEQAGVIGADGQRVELDSQGLPQARCDCPAPGLCKHILGAVLWLRGQDTAAPAPAALPSALNEVLGLDLASLFKTAGRAAVRQAFAAESHGAVEIVEQPGGFTVSWPELGLSCRYLAGLGLAGMVSELPARDQAGLHLAAVLAVWRANGRVVPRPDWLEAEQPAVSDGRLDGDESALLDQVEAALTELLAQGLGHLGTVAAARLGALAVSVRGEGLPRLAAMLRNLAGTLTLLAKRDDRSDSRHALAMMARLYALCAALRAGAAEPARLGMLRGRLRRDYREGEALELLPLGAEWWETRGGARGLTLWCWDAAAGDLKSATLARPDGNDPGFYRHAAWNQLALWPGAGSAEHICQGSLRLESPRLADDQRLAVGGSSRAEVMAPWAADDPRLEQLGDHDWQVAVERLRQGVGLTGQPVEALLLRPQRWLPLRLDEVAQRLDWTVFDAAGQALTLTLRCEPTQRERLEGLSRRLDEATLDLRAVLVRVDRREAVTRLEPLALLHLEASQLRTISLDFDPAPHRRGRVAPTEGRILRLLEARRQPPLAQPGIAGRCLDPLLAQLEAWAELGRPLPGEFQRERLAECAQAARRAGLELPARLTDTLLARPDVAGLLRLYYVAQLAMTLEGLTVAEAAVEQD